MVKEDVEDICFAVKQSEETHQLFVICKINFLDANRQVAYSVKEKYLFTKSNQSQILAFPLISKKKLLSTESFFKPCGELTLLCEFYIASGAVSSEMERIEYGKMGESSIFQTLMQEQVTDKNDSWKDNLQRFYQEGKFNDIKFYTVNNEFPAQKAIVCAHSRVFRAMFERNMKENRTGVVTVNDLEDETVSKMLLFLHTNILEDLDFDMACKLYYAADKYQITSLRKKCLNYLTGNLDTSNVCYGFALADTHQDQQLLSSVRKFIFEHEQEIMSSEDWKKLMQTKPHLTNETMQLAICKKFKTC